MRNCAFTFIKLRRGKKEVYFVMLKAQNVAVKAQKMEWMMIWI